MPTTAKAPPPAIARAVVLAPPAPVAVAAALGFVPGAAPGAVRDTETHRAWFAGIREAADWAPRFNEQPPTASEATAPAPVSIWLPTKSGVPLEALTQPLPLRTLTGPETELNCPIACPEGKLDKGTVQPQSCAEAAPIPTLIATQAPAARPKPRARTFSKPANKDDMESAPLPSNLSLFYP